MDNAEGLERSALVQTRDHFARFAKEVIPTPRVVALFREGDLPMVRGLEPARRTALEALLKSHDASLRHFNDALSLDTPFAVAAAISAINRDAWLPLAQRLSGGRPLIEVELGEVLAQSKEEIKFFRIKPVHFVIMNRQPGELAKRGYKPTQTPEETKKPLTLGDIASETRTLLGKIDKFMTHEYLTGDVADSLYELRVAANNAIETAEQTLDSQNRVSSIVWD